MLYIYGDKNISRLIQVFAWKQLRYESVKKVMFLK